MFDFFCALSLFAPSSSSPSDCLHKRALANTPRQNERRRCGWCKKPPTTRPNCKLESEGIHVLFIFFISLCILSLCLIFVLRNFNLVFIFGELITSFLSAAPPSTACAFWCFVESCLFLDWDSADDCKIIKKLNVCWLRLRQQQLDEDGDEEHMEIGSEESRKITESSVQLKIELTYIREGNAKQNYIFFD